ncbi:MAG: hypothetical protein R3C27_12710 [Hyphomonadaceae bacterium]
MLDLADDHGRLDRRRRHCLHVWRDMVTYNRRHRRHQRSLDHRHGLPRSHFPGFQHYQAKEIPDDNTLRCSTSTTSTIPTSMKKGCSIGHTIFDICEQPGRAYTSREFIYEIGKWLAAGNAKKSSLIQRYERACQSSYRPSRIARLASAS